MSLKSKIISSFVVIALIASGAFSFLIFGKRILSNYIKATVGDAVIDNQKKPTVSPLTSSELADTWQRLARDYENKSVAIQIFDGPTLYRSGNGTVVSSDGLILTIGDIIPQGQQYVYQVQDGHSIFRAQVVERSIANNLALLKVDTSGMNISQISSSNDPEYATSVVLLGKFPSVSGPINFAQSAMVSYTLGSGTYIDTDSQWFLYGAQAVRQDGNLVGIIYIRQGKVMLIKASVLNAFIQQFFSKQK